MVLPPRFKSIYDNDATNVYGPTPAPSSASCARFARAAQRMMAGPNIRSGPIDGSEWGVPMIGIIVMPSSRARAGTGFVVDALTVETAPGTPVQPNACKQDTVDATCGAQGECIFGHCINSTLTWGVNPTAAHRKEMAERWVHLSTHMIGDRNAAMNGATNAPALLALADSALSSRQFLGGMNLFVNRLRDNHTSFGSPSNFTSFTPQIEIGTSSTMGGCFGLVEKDLMGGGLGYAIFAATASPLSGVPLHKGDLLVAIDGVDPKTWVDANYPQSATTLPNDSGSDWGWSATDLSSLITRRASVATFVRCASSTACDAANQTQFDVHVADAIFPALTGTVPTTVSSSLYCSPRFSESATTGDNGGAAAGEDPVYIAAGPNGQRWVEFDGFDGATIWPQQMTAIFADHPAAVLMDARNGHGGLENLLETLFDQVRDVSQPIGVVSLARTSWDQADTADMFTRFGACSLSSESNACFLGGATGFFTAASAPGINTKIAWLNTTDVSANDFAPRLIKGRASTRIFAPTVTSGAFGAITSLPAMLAGINGASMQVQDSRFATDATGLPGARWETSHGVEPDEVCAETLSDAIAGTDTMLTRASAWLAEP